jgi:type IV pilus assembly protein PilV
LRASATTLACFAAQDCSSAQLAAFDIGETMQALHSGFPGGRVRVCRDSAASQDWTCSGGAQAPVVIKMGWLRRQADGSWRATPALVMAAGAAP